MPAEILPKFFNAYVAHVCPVIPRQCLRLPIPEVRRQIDVLHQFQEATAAHHLADGLQGVAFLELMQGHDISALLEAADLHYESWSFLKELAERVVGPFF